MLQSMRERTQGIIAGVIVALICITFALWGIQNYLRGNSAEDGVAKVDGTKITEQEFKAAYERARQAMVAKQGSKFYLDQEAQKSLKKQVLQDLIRNTVLSSAFEDLGLYVGNQQASAIVTHMPYFQVDGQFSYEKFQNILTNMSYSEEAFFDQTRKTMISAQLNAAVSDSAFVLPGEVESALAFDREKRDISYFILPKNKFLSQIKITGAAIQEYYQKHQEEFMAEESVSINYLELVGSELAKTVAKPSLSDLNKLYEKNIDVYTQPKRWQVARILIKLPEGSKESDIVNAKSKLEGVVKDARAGGDFATLMPSNYSITKLSHNQMASDLAPEVEKLQTGQISEAFRTEEGYNVVKILAVDVAQTEPLSKVQAKVEKAYMQGKILDLFTAANDKLTDLTYTNSDSLLPASKELNLPIRQTESFTRVGGKSGLAANPKIFKIAFSDAVLKQGYNSNPIEVASGDVVVLRLKEHIPAKVRSLAEVRSVIEQKLRSEEARKMAEDTAKNILAALNSSSKPAEVAKKYNLTLQSAVGITRQDKRLSSEMLRVAFKLTMLGNRQANSLLPNGDLAILILDKVYLGDTKNVSSAERSSFAEGLKSKMGQYEYSTLINGWMQKAKIKTFSTDQTHNDE